MLLAFYALGLAVPFILSALAFSSVSGFFRFFRDHYTAITVVSGVVLVVMGVLLYTNELTRLNAEALALMGDLGDQLLQRFVGRPRSYFSCFSFRNHTTVLRKVLRAAPQPAGRGGSACVSRNEAWRS